MFFNDYTLETIVHNDHSNIINAKSRLKALASGGLLTHPSQPSNVRVLISFNFLVQGLLNDLDRILKTCFVLNIAAE